MQNEQNPWIQFDILNNLKLVNHCFTTRKGGVSNGVFSSMNLNLFEGDAQENVYENFKRLANSVGLKPEELVVVKQVHGNRIIKVDGKDKGNLWKDISQLQQADGLMTDKKNIGLVTFHADCTPLFFVDPIKQVIGLAHAGWKGTQLHIGLRMIQELQSEYGCDVEDIRVVIGPCICKKCYEISEDVKKSFEKSFDDDIMSKIIKPSSRAKGHYYLDLKEANRISLLAGGILEENLEVSGHCTLCESELFFSHRKMGKHRGTQAAILKLEP